MVFEKCLEKTGFCNEIWDSLGGRCGGTNYTCHFGQITDE